MRLTSTCFAPNGEIPGDCAFAVIHPGTHVALSTNLNPDLRWSDLPAGTRSLVLVCHDPDVPTQLDDFNQEGRLVRATVPRFTFHHWVLVDIPPDLGGIAKGRFSDRVTPRGKPGPDAAMGTRQGLNDYTKWFGNDPDMAGNYFGYDGPCPPWNDEIVHRYVFTLHALDEARCPVAGVFSAPDVISAISGHVLATATLTGRYSLNPEVRV